MIDINLIRENPEAVKENIKKKFQDSKLPLVDEIISLDKKRESCRPRLTVSALSAIRLRKKAAR